MRAPWFVAGVLGLALSLVGCTGPEQSDPEPPVQLPANAARLSDGKAVQVTSDGLTITIAEGSYTGEGNLQVSSARNGWDIEVDPAIAFTSRPSLTFDVDTQTPPLVLARDSANQPVVVKTTLEDSRATTTSDLHPRWQVQTWEDLRESSSALKDYALVPAEELQCPNPSDVGGETYVSSGLAWCVNSATPHEEVWLQNRTGHTIALEIPEDARWDSERPLFDEFPDVFTLISPIIDVLVLPPSGEARIELDIDIAFESRIHPLDGLFDSLLDAFALAQAISDHTGIEAPTFDLGSCGQSVLLGVYDGEPRLLYSGLFACMGGTFTDIAEAHLAGLAKFGEEDAIVGPVPDEKLDSFSFAAAISASSHPSADIDWFDIDVADLPAVYDPIMEAYFTDIWAFDVPSAAHDEGWYRCVIGPGAIGCDAAGWTSCDAEGTQSSVWSRTDQGWEIHQGCASGPDEVEFTPMTIGDMERISIGDATCTYNFYVLTCSQPELGTSFEINGGWITDTYPAVDPDAAW